MNQLREIHGRSKTHNGYRRLRCTYFQPCGLGDEPQNGARHPEQRHHGGHDDNSTGPKHP
jgi:hypothetical protein